MHKLERDLFNSMQHNLDRVETIVRNQQQGLYDHKEAMRLIDEVTLRHRKEVETHMQAAEKIFNEEDSE